MRPKRYSTVLQATLFVLLWNSGFIAAEYGIAYSGPFTLLFWRYWLQVFLMIVYLVLSGRIRWPGFSAVATASLVGILAHGVWLSCGLLAIERGIPVGMIALVVALQPMTTGALSGLVVGEPTPLYRWVGLVVGFLGVLIAVFSRINLEGATSVFGYVIPFGSVVAITVATLIQRKLEVTKQPLRLPLDLALFYQSLATAMVVTIPALYSEGMATQWDPVFVGAILWMTLGVSLPAYAFMLLLLTRLDATRVASLFYLGPPVTMVMAWIAFGDTLQGMDVVGMVVVSIGVLLTQVSFHGSSPIVSEN